MTKPVPQSELSEPPARPLRLLANVAPAAAVVFGLITVGMLVGLAGNIAQLVATPRSLARSLSAVVVVSLVVSSSAALLAGLITYRLGVEVPRTLRGWQDALVERTRVLRDE